MSVSDLADTARRAIWSVDTSAAPWWKKLFYGAVRIIYGVGRDLTEGQVTLRAMSLVYTSILSLVPLLAISFSVLKGFGAHNEIEPFLLDFLSPLGDKAQEVSDQIIGFVDNTRVGVLGSVGFALLFYTVVSLIQKIESGFNYIWHIERERPFTQRFRDYLSVVIVGPALVFSSLGLMATLLDDDVVTRLAQIQPFGWLIEAVTQFIPTAMVIVAFTFIYQFLPNTTVRLRSAFIGGAVAGLMWNAIGWLFAVFVASSTKYTAIYSGFATPIVFMIWLYLGWLILLIGASIAFYDQHPEFAAGRRGLVELSNRSKERLALLVAREIGHRFYAGQPPWNSEDLARYLKASVQGIEETLMSMELAGIVRRSADDPPGYLPGRPWETTTIRDLLGTVRSSGTRGPLVPQAMRPDRVVDDLGDRIDGAIADAVGDITLKDITLSETEEDAEGTETVARVQPDRQRSHG